MKLNLHLPLSILIPAALSLSAVAAAVAGVALSLPSAERAAAEHGRTELIESLAVTQGILEHAFRRGDEDGIQVEVSRLAARRNMRSVVLLDPEGTILASSRLAWRGQSAHQLPFPFSEEELKRTYTQRQVQVLDGSLDKRLIGIGPVRLGAGPELEEPGNGASLLRPWRTAALIAVYDTEYPRLVAREKIIQQAWLPVLVLLALSTLTAAVLHFLITRRAQGLVEATRVLVSGDWGHRVEPSGRDEFAMLGSSFNQMAQQIALIHRDLEERKRHFETLAETTPVGILRTDEEGLVLYANDRMARLCGLPLERLQGTGWLEAIHPEDRPRMHEGWQGTVRRGAPSRGEFRFLRPDGSVAWVEAQAAPELAKQGCAPAGFIATFTDVSKRKEEEIERLAMAESLRQARRLEAIGRLAGGVAHDFNNLLTVILGNLSLIDARLEKLEVDDHALREELVQIASAGDRAARLTRQLLAFSRNQVLEPVPVCLNQIVQGVEKLLRRLVREDVEFRLALDAKLPAVLADQLSIEQALLNLVANAADAVSTGGWIRISTGMQEVHGKEAQALGLEPGAHVVLEVQDTGEGIEQEVLDKVLEPFFTTKPAGQGTGLGLATVHGVVKQSEGALQIQSEAGTGTRVRVLLPVCKEALRPEAKDGRGDRAERAERAGTVLVCEDDTGVLRLTQGLLQSAGYQVLAAEDANQALALVADHPGSIDLLVTDVILPGRNGRELAEALKGMKPKLPVLYLSGYSADILKGIKFDSDDAFLRKPFLATALLDAVGRLARAPMG